jgi:hypothetical protein
MAWAGVEMSPVGLSGQLGAWRALWCIKCSFDQHGDGDAEGWWQQQEGLVARNWGSRLDLSRISQLCVCLETAQPL